MQFDASEVLQTPERDIMLKLLHLHVIAERQQKCFQRFPNVLHDFGFGAGFGAYPVTGPGLIQATNGNSYGTTYQGGTYNYGTGFEITPRGALTTLHSFDLSDGANPDAGLVQASNGRFYGTTYQGGASNYGTVFEINSGGTLSTLHSFAGTDGAYPYAALVQANNGKLYGTTAYGAQGC